MEAPKVTQGLHATPSHIIRSWRETPPASTERRGDGRDRRGGDRRGDVRRSDRRAGDRRFGERRFGDRRGDAPGHQISGSAQTRGSTLHGSKVKVFQCRAYILVQEIMSKVQL